VPLGTSPFDQGKFPFKLLQFMALGIPVVVSATGTPREIVEHGIDGFLAENPADWVRYLMMLADDPALRERMGLAARAKAVRDYSLEAVAPRLIHEVLALS
jgi:glycosyltransferase involved in cell wall biosynthesis